ncbi:MAG: arabinofuranosidase catalytic domain-containing protein [Olleya sp.]
MKHYIYIIILFYAVTSNGQVADYNQFPSMQPQHILDEKLESISFAFSLRILESDYNGALIRLRRASDNLEEDFYCNDKDMVDIDAINTWRNGANVYVTIWYDQSGLNRNAIQATINAQPRFYPVSPLPYFQGDGVNDALIVNTPNGIQDVTNNGDQGTVLTIMNTTRRNQTSWGSATGSSRWFLHGNWGNNSIYFDPGQCCNNPRSYLNTVNSGSFIQYSFLKTDTNVIMRDSGIEKVNGVFNLSPFLGNAPFGIGAANGAFSFATTSFMEFIMYKTDISATTYEEIEENAITFWNL